MTNSLQGTLTGLVAFTLSCAVGLQMLGGFTVAEAAINPVAIAAEPEPAGADMGDYTAMLVRPEDPASRIKDLTLHVVKLTSQEISPSQRTGLWVTVEGTYTQQDHTLLLESKIIQIDEKSENFKVSLPIKGPSTSLSFHSIDSYGVLSTERVKLEFPQWSQWNLLQRGGAPELPGTPGKKNRYSIGLSPTIIAYRETGAPDFTQLATTLKAGYGRVFSPRWDASLSGYSTLFAFLQSQSGVTARYYGANFRTGYSPRLPSSKWKLTLSGGLYYTTMLVTDNRFGFSNMAGPQFYPSVQRALPGNRSWTSYMKYSPVSSTLERLSFSNREFAAGGAYHWKRRTKPHTISATLDLSNLHLEFPGSIIVSSTSLSLGMAYGF